METGKGYNFVNASSAARFPREFIPAVDRVFKKPVQTGVIAGYPSWT